MENGMIVEKGAKITFDTLTLYALWKSDNLGG
jgi:hypothetical protein